MDRTTRFTNMLAIDSFGKLNILTSAWLFQNKEETFAIFDLEDGNFNFLISPKENIDEAIKDVHVLPAAQTSSETEQSFFIYRPSYYKIPHPKKLVPANTISYITLRYNKTTKVLTKDKLLTTKLSEIQFFPENLNFFPTEIFLIGSNTNKDSIEKSGVFMIARQNDSNYIQFDCSFNFSKILESCTLVRESKNMIVFGGIEGISHNQGVGKPYFAKIIEPVGISNFLTLRYIGEPGFPTNKEDKIFPIH